MERWLNKALSFLHLEINPRNVDHGNTRKIKIKVRKDSKECAVIKAKVRVDKHPLISYI
jgi:hypothetical protein